MAYEWMMVATGGEELIRPISPGYAGCTIMHWLEAPLQLLISGDILESYIMVKSKHSPTSTRVCYRSCSHTVSVGGFLRP